MRKTWKFMIPLLALLISACSQNNPSVGVVPLEGVTVSGKVVEADGASGVLLKTDGDRTALLPDSWEYRQGDQVVENVSALQPGSQVQAYAPRGDSQLVAATDKNLVLTSQDDTFTLPFEAFPEAQRQVPVRVQTYGGPQQVMPLQDAIYGNGYTVLPYDGFTSSTFPQAQQYGVSRAVVVGGYDGTPLALIPGQNNLQAVRLPNQYYPLQSVQTNQPVRFTYTDNNVQVNSWDSLTNGQLDIGDLLLAGTLLKALPGQAVVEIGNRPVTVPWNNLRYQGSPVAWNAINPGSPVNLRYYPGVYDIADYRDDTFTMVYNQQVLQIPAQSLPNYVYQRPVYVQYRDGGVHRMPFQKARNLVRDQQCQFLVSPKHAKKWKGWKNAGPQYVHAIPGQRDYVYVGDYKKGRGRVEKRDYHQDYQRHQNVAFGSYQPNVHYVGGKNKPTKGSYAKAQERFQKEYQKHWAPNGSNSKVVVQPAYKGYKGSKSQVGKNPKRNHGKSQQVVRKSAPRAAYNVGRKRANKSAAQQNQVRRQTKSGKAAPVRHSQPQRQATANYGRKQNAPKARAPQRQIQNARVQRRASQPRVQR